MKLSAIVFITLSSISLFADTILLRDGSLKEGKVKAHNLNYLEFEEESGAVIQIYKEKIKKISYNREIDKKNSSRQISKTNEPNLERKEELVTHLDTNVDQSKGDTDSELPSILEGFTPIIFEVTKDGKIYTIPVFGEKFPSSLKVILVSDRMQKVQRFRNLSENSFTLLVDGDDLDPGEYDLLIESEDGIFSQRIGRFVDVVEKEQVSTKEKPNP
jgi:hypothetical protein